MKDVPTEVAPTASTADAMAIDLEETDQTDLEETDQTPHLKHRATVKVVPIKRKIVLYRLIGGVASVTLMVGIVGLMISIAGSGRAASAGSSSSVEQSVAGPPDSANHTSPPPAVAVHHASPPSAAHGLTLTDFSTQPLNWQVTDDPVMGGASSSTFAVAGGVGRFEGTVRVVSFLHAPGFCKITSSPTTLPDASSFFDGALTLTVKSSTPSYTGFRVDWSSSTTMPSAAGAMRHGRGSFKAGFQLPPEAATEFVNVRIPFGNFSVDWVRDPIWASNRGEL